MPEVRRASRAKIDGDGWRYGKVRKDAVEWTREWRGWRTGNKGEFLIGLYQVRP